MFRVLPLLLACLAWAQNSDCRMRLDEAAIDLHGFLRAFYSCQSLGRSFVMDHNVMRPVPSYANFSYGRNNYSSILKEILNPLGLRLVQGKFVDAVVLLPPARDTLYSFSPAPVPASLMGAGAGAVVEPEKDSSEVAAEPQPVPFVSVLDSSKFVKAPRRLRASAVGFLKSSARRMGLDYNEFLIQASPSGVNRLKGVPKFNQLWHVAARASDSLGSMDFTRAVDFYAHDTARIVFGSETRREESKINYESGSALTQYASIFDGLSVDVKGERWSFVWRGNGAMLEVPGIVGACASGSSAVKFEGRSGVPFLSKIPVLNYLFSWENNYGDELLVSVCLFEEKEEKSEVENDL